MIPTSSTVESVVLLQDRSNNNKRLPVAIANPIHCASVRFPSDSLLRFPQGCAVSKLPRFGWIPATSTTVKASHSCRIDLARDLASPCEILRFPPTSFCDFHRHGPLPAYKSWCFQVANHKEMICEKDQFLKIPQIIPPSSLIHSRSNLFFKWRSL